MLVLLFESDEVGENDAAIFHCHRHMKHLTIESGTPHEYTHMSDLLLVHKGHFFKRNIVAITHPSSETCLKSFVVISLLLCLLLMKLARMLLLLLLLL
jgi:hypothetical protein